MRKTIALLLAAALAAGCAAVGSLAAEKATVIQLSDSAVTVDGKPVSGEGAVYTAHDIVYYEEGHDFTYGAGSDADAHTREEAEAHTVVHITEPGTYSVSGTLSAGQIAVDLGEGAEKDAGAVVTLILNGVDITCTVAPAVIFYHVYECGSTDTAAAVRDVDTSAAGANVVIADGTVNTVNGSYVARIYQSYTLSEDGKSVVDSKKLHKYDGAFYSKMSMNVDGGRQGTGVLNINAQNEGLDSELHLTINGGSVNIRSGNDGINTNEDGVSVTTVNGGTLNITVDGVTGEGDGIDSNGWLVINGGTVTAWACSSSPDSGLDADKGIYINGGTVAASGNMYDRIDGGQNYAVFSFASRQAGGTAYTLASSGGASVTLAPDNDFQYLVYSSENLKPGAYTLRQGNTQMAASLSDDAGGPGGMGGHPPAGGGFDPAAMAPPDGTGRPGGQQGGPGGHPPAMPGGQQEGPGGHSSAVPGGQQGDGSQGALTTVLTVSDGGSFFAGVRAAGDDASSLPFSDVSKSDWFYEGVEYAYHAGIISGKTASAFDPDGPLNRGQIVTMLYRQAGSPAVSGAAAFTDVKTDSYCADAVAWAVEKGITQGYADGTFRPGEALSRQQLAVLLYRCAGSPAAGGDLSAYSDGDSVSAFAEDAVAWAAGGGLMTNGDEQALRPRDTATRAETAVILQRFSLL